MNKKGKLRKWSKQQLKDLEDNNIPIVHSESIEELEKKNGRGFWGNKNNGYIYDKDLKQLL